jgi:hypothetical protein
MSVFVKTDKEDNNETTMVTFTIAELWMLSDKIRHETENEEDWYIPPTSFQLNQEISLAIYICENFSLYEYTIPLDFKKLTIIDYNVRRTDTTPEGAKGRTILLKCYEGLYNLLFKSPKTPDNSDKVFTPSQKKKLGAKFYGDNTSTNADENPDKDT